MKVVINRCCGGFGVSPEALLALIKRGSPIVSTYPDDPNSPFAHLDRRTPVGDGFVTRDFLGTVVKDGLVYHVDRSSLDRSHPDLIWVVETLGERASGSMSKLKIVEIPDGIEYGIDDYDGMEKVQESHREWS